MSAESLLEREIFFSRIFDPFETEERKYASLTELATVEELIEKESCSKHETYQAQTLIFNEFLKKRFGIDLPGFMQLYTKEHFKALGFKEEEGIALPVGPTTICYFAESSTPDILSQRLVNYQASVVPTLFGGTRLNLHNDTIYKFTIVRANFNLETAKSQFFFGYHFTTDKFRFFIKSSAQLDITVVYEEI